MRAIIIKFTKRKVPGLIASDYHKILTNHSTYYNLLDAPNKAKFILRLYQLLNIVSFGSPEIPVITREMRAVIGSAIIEITFGLNRYLPTRFTNIQVMPRRYMYPGYGEPFLGHIDYTNNQIYFSWQDVKEGFLIPDDAVNVALHEMAHVLEAENGFNELFTNFFSRFDWKEWAELAFNKMQVIRAGQNRFLKDYGGISMTEMFAVCIEAFFEQPQEFRKNLPQIYTTMVELLNQDTALMRDNAGNV